MKKKTILFLNHTGKLGGGEIALFHLATSLDPLKFTPVVVLGSDGKLRERFQRSGVECHVIPLDQSVGETRKDSLGYRSLLRIGAIFPLLAWSWKLSRFMKKRMVDALHANSLKADILGAISARLAGVPLVWHVRDRIETDYLPAPAVHAFRWLCATLPDHVIANSKATMATLGPSKKENRSVVYCGVHMPDFAIPYTSKTNPVIGLVGRISPWKGQDVFIRAAHLVRQRFPNVQYKIIGSVMFGEEAYEREIRDTVAKLGLADAIEFTGFQENVRKAMRELDILVHASTTGEPFGQVVAEGMSLAKPVVATCGGGVPEVLEHAQSGILVPMRDAGTMAKAIIWLLENPQQASDMGKAARHRIQSHFQVDHAATQVADIYERLLG